MKYIIFCKPSCPFCVKAVSLLEDSKKSFKVVDFNEDQIGVLQEIKAALEWQTVPMIFTKSNNDMKFIGGFTDLAEHLKDG